MRAVTILVTAFCSLGVGAVYADSTTASVQQALKDQGFYYGEITGTKDADTTAAIRRYQIRNGLQITGELNAETRKSLGLQGTAPTTPAPIPVPPAITPRPEPPDSGVFPFTILPFESSSYVYTCLSICVRCSHGRIVAMR